MKSDYEIMFAQWLRSAERLGYVKSWEYEPKTFIVFDCVDHEFKKYLKTKTKYISKCIIEEITYTPDFRIEFTDKFFKDFPNAHISLDLVPHKDKYWIDVKSTYQGKSNSSNREFPAKRAKLYEIEGIYTTRVALDKKYNWFYYTYVPHEMAYMKNRKVKTVKKMFKTCKII